MDIGGAAESESEALYSNSISGMLWLDVYEDVSNGIYSADGTRQVEESPLAGYTVSLYKADDPDNAVRETATDVDGLYQFKDMEPGAYVVGVKAETVDGTNYLLPLVGIKNDNRFADWSDDYTQKYSEAITIDVDTVVTGIGAAMRIPPGIAPMVNATHTININSPSISGIPGVSYSGGILTFNTAVDSTDTYVITGTGAATSNRIVVNANVKVNITLSNVNMSNGVSPLQLNGTVNLTLADGSSNFLTCTQSNENIPPGIYAGIYVEAAAVLTIDGTGTLTARGGAGGAGIGGSHRSTSNASLNWAGTITINGGTVIITGGYGAAGIGGGAGAGFGVGGNGGTINIGGTANVTATGGNTGAGIGGGGNGNGNSSGSNGGGGTITISGGSVDARGMFGGAGIGGGYTGNGGTINIGGTANVTATGSSGTGAGIGGGYGGPGGNITISGGTVTATGGTAGTCTGAGIGGGTGTSGTAGNITINGGTVTATGRGTGVDIGGSNTTGSIVFTGGSILPTRGASSVRPSPTNGSANGGNTVSMITFEGYSGGDVFSTVAGGTIKSYTYNATAHPEGKVYAWLALPSIRTDPATNVTAASAELNGTYHMNGTAISTAYFEWGTYAGYGSTEPLTVPSSTAAGTTDTASASLTGLTANTTYHYRLVITVGSTTIHGNDVTFTTPSPSNPPSVTVTHTVTGGATATLSGTYDLHGETFVSGLFEISTDGWTWTTPAGGTLDGSTDTPSVNLTGLTPGATYQYRLTIISGGGQGMAAGSFMTSSTADVTVTKTVAGDYGDQTKEFVFTIYFQDSNGTALEKDTRFTFAGGIIPQSGATAPADGVLTLDDDGKETFTLKHGQTITIAGVATDGRVCIVETTDPHYTTSFKDSEDAGPTSAADTGVRNMTNEDRIFDFTNARITVTPGGISLGSIGGMVLPALLALMAAMSGLIAAAIYRRFVRAR